MVSKKGSLLEKSVADIFRSLGFHTETNVRKKGYEIDVLAKKGNFEIIVECKQYEKGSLTVRNLIHQWSDKNSVIKADRVLLVLYGINVKEADKDLARSRNIILWDEETLHRYMNLTMKNKEEALKRIIRDLNLDVEDEGIRDLRNVGEAKKLAMLTLMSGKPLEEIDEEDLYGSFILSLKRSLQATLRAKSVKNLEQHKKAYAELFSRVEREGRTNKEKWERVKEIIKEDDKLFPKGEVKKAHLDAVKKIEEYFERGKRYFDEKDKEKLRHKLIKTALELIRDSADVDTICFMSRQNKKHKVSVYFQDDEFHFAIDKKPLSPDKIEKLDWIIDEPKVNSTRPIFKRGSSLVEEVETVEWSIENNLNKATRCVENLYKEIFVEQDDFDIVLEGLYRKPSWILFLISTFDIRNVSFWIWIIFGICAIKLDIALLGLLFFYLAYRKYKKIRNRIAKGKY